MKKSIDINILTGRAKKLGVKVDRSNNNDNLLSGDEINIFFDECKSKNINLKNEDWFGNSDVQLAYLGIMEPPRKEGFICQNDAIQVKRPDFKEVEILKLDRLIGPKMKCNPQVADRLADSWADAYGIDNSDGSFTEFVEKLYDVIQELNISNLNGSRDKSYPTKQDQIVDELLGAFANESKFNPKAVSSDGLYHGIFQFSEVGMKELKNKGAKIPIISMSEFDKLPRERQLDYMVEAVKVSKKYYSKLGDEPISAKQVYAMWKFPSAGNPDARIKYGKKVHVGSNVQQEKAEVISIKQKNRGDVKL